MLLPTFERLKADIRPSLLTRERVTATLWAGSPGAQSPAHHDLAFNLYIQVVGEKRFLLLPHSAVSDLCVHGRYHPHARQSRYVDIATDALVNSSRMSAANCHLHYDEEARGEAVRRLCPVGRPRGHEVILRPGNVLFVPPFWYHEVVIDYNSSGSHR